jgi:hypothetical protein
MNPIVPDIDEDLELWDQFVQVVRWLRESGRAPDLTLPMALRDALDGWIAEQVAENNEATSAWSSPFVDGNRG